MQLKILYCCLILPAENSWLKNVKLTENQMKTDCIEQQIILSPSSGSSNQNKIAILN